MFPNPQSALPLPPHPSLERYKKLAKQLVKACKSGDESAIANWVEQWIRTLGELAGRKSAPEASAEEAFLVGAIEDFARRRLLSSEPGGKKCALADAQFVIARSHGFESWPRFVKHLEALARKSSSVSRFEAAADAIVGGDAATLKRLLREDPKLVRAISTREHNATLLHYVSANGVEGYRQKTPENIVEIAEMLLNAGAEIDATANVYGGECTTLGLAATSEHPERAGVQEALLQTLLDHSAGLEQPSLAGNQQSIVMACVANERPKAAQFLANRGAPLDLTGAAALGQLAIVESFFPEGDTTKPSPNQEQRNEGFIYACRYGHYFVVEFLLDRGVDLAAQAGGGQTALHHATIGGHLEIVKLLLRCNAPLEVKNMFGGTVLGQVLWSAGHGGDPDVYIAILEALLAAGAKVPEHHVPVNALVDAWMARHGSRAEASWSWDGEEPSREK
jgi:Ankyrin repeats (3 copies)